MLYRKFEAQIETFLQNNPNKILLVNGARQIGKTYLIRHVGTKMFANFVEVNLKEDKEGPAVFSKVKSTADFYLQLSSIAGGMLDRKDNTLVFLDEIQSYPHLLTMLKFLNQEGRFTYIASGSQLGVALAQTPSVPIGSIAIEQMYPLDFEEFLLAMGCGSDVIEHACGLFSRQEPLSQPLHDFMMRQFKLYLLVGGLPEAINEFVKTRNIATVRSIQKYIQELYRLDASQYDDDHKLVIRRVYDLIPSCLENKKKRIVVKDIEPTGRHKQFQDYYNEFEYITQSGIALPVQAISNPVFPLIESEQRNLLKLYLNDVGLLTGILYNMNINAVLDEVKSINLGTVYESVVAQELCAHGFKLHYYDNKKKGEVDFLVDDFERLQVLPIEVKSGKNYTEHSALNAFVSNPDYHIARAIVLNNDREVTSKNGIIYMPIYYCMFLRHTSHQATPLISPPRPTSRP